MTVEPTGATFSNTLVSLAVLFICGILVMAVLIMCFELLAPDKIGVVPAPDKIEVVPAPDKREGPPKKTNPEPFDVKTCPGIFAVFPSFRNFNYEGWFLCGKLCSNENFLDVAVDAYLLALFLLPKEQIPNLKIKYAQTTADAAVANGLKMAAKGDHIGAAEQYHFAQVLCPIHPASSLGRGSIVSQLTRFSKAVSLDSCDAKAWNQKIIVLLASNHLIKARQTLMERRLQKNLLTCWDDNKLFEWIVAEHGQRLEEDYSLYDLLSINYGHGRHMDVLKNASILIEQDPTLADAHMYRGMSLMALNDNRSALIDLEKSTRLQPNNAMALLMLSRVGGKLGDDRTCGSALFDASNVLERDQDTWEKMMERHPKAIIGAPCPICQEALGDGTRTLECHHRFHTVCLTKWVNEHGTCPCCRATVADDFVIAFGMV